MEEHRTQREAKKKKKDLKRLKMSVGYQSIQVIETLVETHLVKEWGLGE